MVDRHQKAKRREENILAIITISRGYANNGDVIAKEVAERTGWPLIDKTVFKDVLAEYGLIELNEFLEADSGFFGRMSAAKNQQYVDMFQKIMMVLAKRGNAIIVGRGGFEILKELQNALHVVIKAPTSERLWFAMERDELSKEEAEAAIKRKDELKTAFLDKYYNVTDHELAAFDIMLDSSLVTLDTAATLLIEAANRLDENPKATKLTSEEIECDPILEDAIFKVLKF